MAEVVRQDMTAFLHRLSDHDAAHRATEPTDAYVFGEGRRLKYIRSVNGSAYDTGGACGRPPRASHQLPRSWLLMFTKKWSE